ncbi:MAG: hypothetical protein ABL872_00640 [Lacibacter sp.]
MNWKHCFTALISLGLICFPYNIIGCGGSDDPYDYYTSFFSQKLNGDESFRPFYYTGYRFLYDEMEPVSTKEMTSEEWVGYTTGKATKKDVQQFVLKYSYKQLSTLYNHIEKKQALTLPDSVKKNSFTQWFIQNKDLEALGYLMYAKQVEPFVAGDEDMWADINRDAEKMKRLTKSGIQLWTVAKNDFIRLRYGYQVTRLAHYSEQYQDCITYYDTYIKPNSTASVLQDLAVGLKAGALKHLGKREEAAYNFSQLFAGKGLKRRSNYISFIFSTRDEELGGVKKEDVLKLCKNNKEKANVTAIYAMSSVDNNLQQLKQIYQLDPTSPLLELLTIREVNKLEEKYLHPTIQKEKGNKLMYSWSLFGWDTDKPNYDSLYNESEQQTKDMISFCHSIAQDNTIPNRGLFEVAAAYTAYMTKDLKKAKELLSSAEKSNLSPAVKDQWMLTNLLVTINEKQTIDAAFEEQLLPSIQWLEGKANKDEEWKKFYRNLFTEVIALKYHAQNDIHKEVLSIGIAEKMLGNYYNSAITFLRTKMNSKDVEKMYAFMLSKSLNKWESYLVRNNSFSKDDVADIAGTAYIRESDWANAERWLKQITPGYYKTETYTTYLSANPFADLIYDTHSPTKQDTVVYTKLRFAQKMKQLLQQTTTGTDLKKAKAYYQMANGLYQASYWGNSWMLQEYGWSSNDGLDNTHKEGSWQKEYFGVFKAEQFYLKAKELSKDENFKARCVWMAAKCSQKQLVVPGYESFSDYDLYDKASEKYAKDIRKNKYYDGFVKEYSKTFFFKEAFNSCVYLKDYIKSN